MRITIDPMPLAKAAKKAAVNRAFSLIAAEELHLDLAYAQKRDWAINDRQRLKPEALLRKVTTDELAEAILSKSDLVAEREARRQRIMKRIDDATTIEELEAVNGE
jgi:hypothetical protein